MEQYACIFRVEEERSFLFVADRLAVLRPQRGRLRIPCHKHLELFGNLIGRKIYDVILDQSFVAHRLSVDGQIVYPGDVCGLTVRQFDLPLDFLVGFKFIHAVACKPLRYCLDIERLISITIGIDIVDDHVVLDLIDDNALIHDFHGRANARIIIDLLDVGLLHADAAIGDVAADGFGMIRAVDAVVSPDLHPTIAERIALPRRDRVP